MSEQQRDLVGACHCGAVEFVYAGRPAQLVQCNCSICRRLRPLWGHGTANNITISASEGRTIAYVWGDRGLAFHTCRTCGCTTHYRSLGSESPLTMAVNVAMCDPADIADLPIRHFDGAVTWRFVD